MTERYGWVLNLDAELELARNRPGYVPRRKLLAQLSEHGASSRQLLAPGDVLIDQGSEAPAGLVGRAWCPTPLALAKLRAAGVTPEPSPEAAVLRRVNHRLFAHQLGGGLARQAYVTSREELVQHVDDCAQRWLVKRPLEFAGRGQMRVLGPLTEKQWSWVDASFERDGLLVEPLVSITFEVSLHGFVWPDGHHELGRVCAQQVSERGAFRGVRLAEPGELGPEATRAFQERGTTTALALHGAGYFGPFGIDGYRYTLDGSEGFCALGELNARYTLGFVTGFPRHPSELRLS
jgi:hypothetical protein